MRSFAARLGPALAILVAAGVVTYLGWRLLWFLTDDAYICFRYASNSLLGHGYVWNAPPFRPVEGYSCFLWVVLLDLLWRLLGSPPPETANTVGLLCGLLTLVLVTRAVWRLDWAPRLRRYRTLLLGLALLILITNRTFLTWISSGLETALFVLLVTGWVYLGALSRARLEGRALALAALTAALYLTRPDGLLFVAAALPILAILIRSAERPGRAALTLLPLLAVPIHLLWRHSFYGEWLPNTYYAKVVAAWPASGWRYAAAFLLEYGLWIWIALAGWLLIRRGRAGRGAAPPVERRRRARRDRGAIAAPSPGRPIRMIVLAALGVHFLYYTLIIGGDHFEYRVYAHLIPLLAIGASALISRSRARPLVAAAWLTTGMLLALPIPWTHWAHSRHLEDRRETYKLRVAVAPHWPAALRWYAQPFDRLQDWLISHMVCMRHQEHHALHLTEQALYPPREEGARISAADYPVFCERAIGYPAWIMPHVNIIDVWGLNDYVIARTPRPRPDERRMAHDRWPPPGYMECFQPNVRLTTDRQLLVSPREEPLTAERIIACEQDWARRVRP